MTHPGATGVEVRRTGAHRGACRERGATSTRVPEADSRAFPKSRRRPVQLMALVLITLISNACSK